PLQPERAGLMATLPDYVEVAVAGWGEEPDPAAERTAMVRGPARETVLNSGLVHETTATRPFKGQAIALNYRSCWDDTVGRSHWLDMTHPISGETISAHFKGGAIGRVTPRNRAFTTFQRTVTLEWLG